MDTLTPISPIEVIEPVNTPVNQQAQQSEKEKCLGGKSKVSPGKFEAECKYYSKTWKCEKVSILEEHLASHCLNVPRLVLREYMQKVGARENISNKKRKLDKSTTGQTTITAFHDLKLNAGYNPPTREYLSEHLFETELFIINDKIEDDIMNQQNLTLTLDGWTSGHYQSIWNFVIFTSSPAKIEDVIEKIGPNRISAIVSDNAANVKKARAIISEKYPRIENVQCISHCINLVTYNIIYHIFADQLLHKVNILGFFSQLSYGSGIYTRNFIYWKNLGFDLEESHALCSQLNQYKKKEFPFDLEFGYGFEELISWWNIIETKPQPNSLPLIALHLFSIYPNSASCENGFLTLGWLTNKYIKHNSKLSDIELNQRITKALAEPDDADEDDNIGKIPEDLENDLFNNTKGKNDNENTLTNDNDTIGKGILDYNINDLFDKYVNE
ncbi:hypothetical protein RhiirB3_451667 [Rhizophagus irregularis]|nr:hypothetical protein RhiirB3_451667 [Rhizophagus irregularis]